MNGSRRIAADAAECNMPEMVPDRSTVSGLHRENRRNSCLFGNNMIC